VIEWIVIGGIAAALGRGLLKGGKDSQTSWSPPAPLLNTLPAGPTAAEEERQWAAWHTLVETDVDRSRWIPSGTADRLVVRYPPPPPRRFDPVRLAHSLSLKMLGRPDPHGLRAKFDAYNKTFLKQQKVELKTFFDTVEKSPLTEEQAHACICMDDNVLVVAAAGSGKTSTMVAKAGYVLRQSLATPDQILLLAFNREAAEELGKRIQERLADFPGIENVTAKTFDAFGLSVIGEATGEKPHLARWVSDREDIAEVIDIARSLGALDPTFRQDWDLFRTVYARDVGSVGERAEPEDFDGTRRGFRTADGKIVKSKEEQLISNWLFYNGVNYAYERAYEHKTASQQHSQYHPDFYYPDIDLYHEHFALDEKENAPAHFGGDYVAGVHWKRALHAEKDTALFETTSAEIRSDEAFRKLREALVSRGLTLSFDANRKTVGPTPMTDQQLASTLRVFQQHVKSNRLSQNELDHAAHEKGLLGHEHRLRLFLKLYERVAAEWERRLAQGGCIDFEDMLRLAADHIEAGRYQSRFKVVFADEFQDSSRARARLLQALTRNCDDVHLTVVGDDWQGINRFAGADLRVMSEFGSFFSHSTTLQLTTTFRCPQALCDISSEFVQANPKQLKKTVQSTSPFDNRPLQAFGFKDMANADGHIEQQLGQMAKLLAEGRLQAGKGGRTNILLLGRYKNDRPKRLSTWQRMFADQLVIDFKTVHASKGLEAEYVYVLGLIEGRRGFPSQIEDDPVLQLAMPDAETFSMAEERRLFYVALTRASRQVRLYTSLEKPSRFVTELASQERIMVEPVDGEALETCPKCQSGVLKLRTSGHTPFHGCSRYPQCDFKRSIEDGEVVSMPVVRLALPVTLGSQCPTCGNGTMRVVDGKHGKFVGCSAYPSCKTTGPIG
jgi:DNA helicase-4